LVVGFTAQALQRGVLLGITMRGDKYLRSLQIHGPRAALKAYQRNPAKMPEQLAQLLQRKHPHVVCVALASRNARVAWAMLSRRQDDQGRETVKAPSVRPRIGRTRSLRRT
jgi:transposase